MSYLRKITQNEVISTNKTDGCVIKDNAYPKIHLTFIQFKVDILSTVQSTQHCLHMYQTNGKIQPFKAKLNGNQKLIKLMAMYT